jgi:hypothetical protein
MDKERMNERIKDTNTKEKGERRKETTDKERNKEERMHSAYITTLLPYPM